MKPYEEFLEEKVAFDEAFGFDVRDVDLHRVLNVTHIGKSTPARNSWDNREESTWIDKL